MVQIKMIKKTRIYSFFIFVCIFSLLLNFVCSFLFQNKEEPTIEDLFYEGQRKLSKKEYSKAQETFQKIFDEATDNEMRIRALFLLGDSFFYDWLFK